MVNTTLCYLEKDGCWLMLYRNRKTDDPNGGKWIGVGGHFLAGESPEECVRREILEETGLTVRRPVCRGIVTFVSDVWEQEMMHLFTADSFDGVPRDCDEGELAWIPFGDIGKLPLWEGDRIFLQLLRTRRDFFSLKLVYRGDTLISASLDGEPLTDLP